MVSPTAFGPDTGARGNHSWEVEWDECVDSQKVLHRAKDSDFANAARLNTSVPTLCHKQIHLPFPDSKGQARKCPDSLCKTMLFSCRVSGPLSG